MQKPPTLWVVLEDRQGRSASKRPRMSTARNDCRTRCCRMRTGRHADDRGCRVRTSRMCRIRLELAKAAYQRIGGLLGFARATHSGCGRREILRSGLRQVCGRKRQMLCTRQKLDYRAPSPLGVRRRQTVKSACEGLFCCALAIPSLIGLIGRYGGSPRSHAQPASLARRPRRMGDRTRHLLPPAYDPGSPAVLLLHGRPRARIEAVRNMIIPNTQVSDVEFAAAIKSCFVPCALCR